MHDAAGCQLCSTWRRTRFRSIALDALARPALHLKTAFASWGAWMLVLCLSVAALQGRTRTVGVAICRKQSECMEFQAQRQFAVNSVLTEVSALSSKYSMIDDDDA